MRGVAFQDAPDAEPRGLSWSDCAVLFRSVAKDAGPLVDELRRRGIPYVVKGLNRLFDSPEIQAVVGVFRYMVGEIDEAELRDSVGRRATCCRDAARLGGGDGVLDEGRDFDRGERWGVYNIQRLYLDFLEALELREDTVPGDPGTRRAGLLPARQVQPGDLGLRADLLQHRAGPEVRRRSQTGCEHQAPDYYADVGRRRRVRHARRGHPLDRPPGQGHAVAGRSSCRACDGTGFPSKRHGGLGLFHVIPDDAVAEADRYRGTVEDETRLFYVAVTRAQKYLFVTFSPGAASSMYSKRSTFFDHCARADRGSRPGRAASRSPSSARAHSRATRRRRRHAVVLRAQVPVRVPLPVQAALPLRLQPAAARGARLRQGSARRAGRGAQARPRRRACSVGMQPRISSTGTCTRRSPTPSCDETLRRAAIEAIERYLDAHGDEIPNTVHCEKQIQVHVAPGITVDGRIDLVRRLDTDELAIVDFKSTDRAQDEDVTRDQLHVYAVGYEELTGETADLIEVLNLDEEGKTTREEVEAPLLRACGSGSASLATRSERTTSPAQHLVRRLRPMRRSCPLPKPADHQSMRTGGTMSPTPAAGGLAKLAAKYGPHAAVAIRVVGPAAREAVVTQQQRLQNRRYAFDKARTLADGSVLRLRDGTDVVWVVFSGDEPVTAYPADSTPIVDLVGQADLSKRVTPAEHDAAKARRRAGRAARRAAARARPRRRRRTPEPSRNSVDMPDC